MKIKVEFSGGLEMMFSNEKTIELDMKEEVTDPHGATATKTLLLEDVIEELRKNHLREKEEMFI